MRKKRIDKLFSFSILYFSHFPQFLLPYVNMLGVVGLRPITIDTSDYSAYLGHIQMIIVVALLTTGYFTQYLSCFRWVPRRMHIQTIGYRKPNK